MFLFNTTYVSRIHIHLYQFQLTGLVYKYHKVNDAATLEELLANLGLVEQELLKRSTRFFRGRLCDFV